jgi:hypothetical protein
VLKKVVAKVCDLEVWVQGCDMCSKSVICEQGLVIGCALLSMICVQGMWGDMCSGMNKIGAQRSGMGCWG